MNKAIFMFLLVFIACAPSKVLASNCDNLCKEATINSYFENLSVVFRKGSAYADIESLFSLIHSDAKYEHYEYNANFNRRERMNSFKNNLSRGAYGKGKMEGIRVDKYIFGKSHVAVEYSYGEQGETGDWVPKGDQKLLAIFGFKDNKIILVREYW